MGRHRWDEADALFEAALDQPPDSRRSFVESATSDRELKAQVLALLDSLQTAERRIGESADEFVSRLSSGALGPLDEPFLLPGTRIGAYVIVRELGHGGMGRVYLANRADQDFDRPAAIKVVRSDLGADAVVRRFLAERRILAGLEHPNIARLYDSGVTPDGQPYLVMEHVAGARIDRHVDERRLSVDARLALFDAVCGAVAFAHQRLVIHRDLKPANILVSDDDRVTLLDFGIAKLLGQDGEDGETLTRAGQRMLTPEYACPELVRGDPPTASMDVYALGVILHELLTGRRPEWQRLVAADAEGTRIDGAMTPPSTVAPPDRRRRIRGDLDTIVLTALALEPSRRYASVQALRDDLVRHRQGLPILARPAALGYRAAKFVRRHTLGTATAAMVLLLAASFVASVMLQSRRVAAERDRANAQRDRAQQTAQLLTDLFKTSDPFRPGREDTMRVAQFLAEGTQRVNAQLVSQPALRAQLLTVLGGVYRWRGDQERAAQLLDTAVALYRAEREPPALELAEALTELGNVRRFLGRIPAAESLHRQALTLRSEAIGRARASSRAPEGVDARPIAASLANVGASLLEQGKFAEAAPLIDSALAIQRARPVLDTASVAEILNYKATLAFRSGDENSALTIIQEAHRLNRARLGPDHPRVALELSNIGVGLLRQGRVAEAEAALREAERVLVARLSAQHFNAVSARANLASAWGMLGKLPEADSLLRLVIATDRSGGEQLQLHLPTALDQHGDVLRKRGHLAEAGAAYREALALLRGRYPAGHPAVAVADIKLAAARCAEPGRDESRAALAGFERARRVLDSALTANHPNRVGARAQHGDCLSRSGERAAGELELEASFDAAVQGWGVGYPLTRSIGEWLLAHYARSGDAAGQARVRTVLDSTAGRSR